MAAVDRLADREDLEQVVARAKNRAAAKRASAVLRELDERAARETAAAAAAAHAPGPPGTGMTIDPDDASVCGPLRKPKPNEPGRMPGGKPKDAADSARAQQEAEQAAAEQRVREEAERSLREAAAQAAREEEAAREAERRRQADEAEARVRREGLNRLNQLVGRASALVEKPDLSLKSATRVLRDVRAALADVPPLPSRREYDEVVQRLKAVQAALTPKVQDLRDVAEWQRWANIGIQEQLCEKMEALRTVDDPEAVARRIHELQEQWRQAADVPRAQGEALWRRFKAVHDELWARCEAHFAAQASVRAENLAKKAALCERAEALADSTNWLQTADAIKGLQAEWKTIGPVTRGQEKAIWERFRAACDRFFTEAPGRSRQAKGALGRELREERSALSRRRGARRLDRLGGDGRRDPPAADRMEDHRTGEEEPVRNDLAALSRGVRRVLRPLRAAARHRARRTRRGARSHLRRNRSARAFAAGRWRGSGATASTSAGSAASEPPADLAATVRGLRTRWQQELAARGVDRDQAATLDRRFADAFDRVISRWPEAFAGTDLDPDANRKQMEALVKRLEDLAASLKGGSPD